MVETPSVRAEALSTLFWVSWLILLYLAWPRLIGFVRHLLRKLSGARPVKLTVQPVIPKWDAALETNLARVTTILLGLSILGLLLRSPQLERYSIPLFALALGLTLLVRWWRGHVRSRFSQNEILFPHILTNTTLGLRLLKVQEFVQKLSQIALELHNKGGASTDIAVHLEELIEKIWMFLTDIRLEPPDSATLRQARSMFVWLETLADSFDLLGRLSDEAEIRTLSIGLINILGSAKRAIDKLRTALGA